MAFLNDGFTLVLSGRTVLFVTVSAGRYPGLRKPLGFQPVSACMRVVLLSHHNKNGSNRRKRIETYDGQKRMLYLCNVVQEKIIFAQNIPSAHRHGQLLSKSQVTPH